MIAVVIKQFANGTQQLLPGTIVDSSAWRNEAGQLRVRQLRPASPSEIAHFEAQGGNPETPVMLPRLNAAKPAKVAKAPAAKVRQAKTPKQAKPAKVATVDETAATGAEA